ncbi:MAG: hemolysin III family protein [Bacilli bacterium]
MIKNKILLRELEINSLYAEGQIDATRRKELIEELPIIDESYLAAVIEYFGNNSVMVERARLELDQIKASQKTGEVVVKKERIPLPNYSLAEELWNSISHGLGAIFGILVLIFSILALVTKSNITGNPIDGYELGAAIVYSVSIMILYTISCIYHALGRNAGKKVMRVLDHDMVYLLIAGTYTPFCICALREVMIFNVVPLGWLIFAIVWVQAIIGITFNSINIQKYKVLSMVLYITMGWTIIFAAAPLMDQMGVLPFVLLLLGGISYTVGSILYGIGAKKKGMHSVFHFFVLVASFLQFAAIYVGIFIK